MGKALSFSSGLAINAQVNSGIAVVDGIPDSPWPTDN
jgi:hypothetical protein